MGFERSVLVMPSGVFGGGGGGEGAVGVCFKSPAEYFLSAT